VAGLFLIVAQAVLRVVVNVRRVAPQDSSPAAAVLCIRRVPRPEALQERLAPVLASVLVSVHVPVSVARAPEWVARRAVLYRLQVKLRVHSVQVARSVVAASNTRRQKKAR
jgi:hypothetical protein